MGSAAAPTVSDAMCMLPEVRSGLVCVSLSAFFLLSRSHFGDNLHRWPTDHAIDITGLRKREGRRWCGVIGQFPESNGGSIVAGGQLKVAVLHDMRWAAGREIGSKGVHPVSSPACGECLCNCCHCNIWTRLPIATLMRARGGG